MSYALELKDLRKSFGKSEIIRGTQLQVRRGERVAIMAFAHSEMPVVSRNLLLDEHNAIVRQSR